MKKNSKTFCILPWMHVSTSPSGNLRVCCNGDFNKNFILNSDGSPYKIYKDDLKKAWHAPFYKKIRWQMLDGQRPEMCAPCFREEEACSESPRTRYNQKYMFDYEPSETPPFHIKYIDLRLGNKCNLRCRMCNPYVSNSMLREWEELSKRNLSQFIRPLSQNEKKKFKNLSWPEKMDFSKFLQLMQYVEEIYLTGGEPLLIQEQYDLLEQIIQKGFASNISLKYNTNLTKYDFKIGHLWKHFKKIHLHISIDGFGKLNDYIRYPSQWTQIENNLKEMISLNEKLSNMAFRIDCTVQMYNITSMTDLLWWVKKQNLDLYLNILDTPKFLNIRVLPDELKKKARESLLPFQKDFPVKKIIDYMERESWMDYLDDFFHWTDFFDKSRNQNLNDVLPELSACRSA
ncbi:MAG: twitch domain-containing radical SAM protein [Oligoflexia bacterium]|nr:twitch domain-containing radical SAM protein [Oligoflexia bacterium]